MSLKGDSLKKHSVRESFETALELPIELLKNIPRATVIGNECVLVENYKAIVEYEKNLIRLSNNVSVLGENLNVAEITSDEIIINGKIKSIEF